MWCFVHVREEGVVLSSLLGCVVATECTSQQLKGRTLLTTRRRCSAHARVRARACAYVGGWVSSRGEGWGACTRRVGTLAVRTCDWCRCECTLTSAKTTAWHFRSYTSLPCSHNLLPERNIFASIYRRKRQNDNCVTVSRTCRKKNNSAN